MGSKSLKNSPIWAIGHEYSFSSHISEMVKAQYVSRIEADHDAVWWAY